mgnify:CR=1 FL=1
MTAPSACAGCDSLRLRLDEANRLMNAYRVKAHALDRELDATRDRLSKSRASHKQIIADLRAQLKALDAVSTAVNDGMRIIIEDRNATIAGLQGDGLLHDRIHPTSGPMIASMPLPNTSKRGGE